MLRSLPDDAVRRLTNRELDAMIRQLRAEWRRRTDAVRSTYRRGPLSVEAAPRPAGAGGKILRFEGDLRVVQCAACACEFRVPKRRGRAPRNCEACRNARTAPVRQAPRPVVPLLERDPVDDAMREALGPHYGIGARGRT